MRNFLCVLEMLSLAVLVASIILILTNALNMWLPGIVSLALFIGCFIALKVTKN